MSEFLAGLTFFGTLGFSIIFLAEYVIE